MAADPDRSRDLRRFSDGPNPLGAVLVLIPLLVALAFLVLEVAPRWGVPPWALVLAVASAALAAAVGRRRFGDPKLWRRTRLRMAARMRFRGWGAARTCGFCLGALGVEAEQGCGGCGASYHSACLAELGRCGTLGCSEGGVPAPRDQRPLKG